VKKYLLAALLIASPSYANTVNTTSNSTGSVTNQAVQVVPSRQFTSGVGSGISCQGATLNISPFLSATNSYSSPYEPYYDEPIYDTTTNDDTGALINPGTILYYKPVRTGQKSNNVSLNSGITATFSIPLDRQQIRLCKAAMKKQVELYEHSVEAKKLNYHLSRLATCAKHFNAGVKFKESSPFHKICDDVELVNPPNTLPNHRHELTNPFSVSEKHGSSPFEALASQEQTPFLVPSEGSSFLIHQ
jgi:hypothetical protein